MSSVAKYTGKDLLIKFGNVKENEGYVKVTIKGHSCTLTYRVKERLQPYKVSIVGSESWFASMNAKFLELTIMVMKFTDSEFITSKSPEQIVDLVYANIVCETLKDKPCKVFAGVKEKSAPYDVVITDTSLDLIIGETTAVSIATFSKDVPTKYKQLLKNSVAQLDRESYDNLLMKTHNNGYAYIDAYVGMNFIESLLELHDKLPRTVRH